MIYKQQGFIIHLNTSYVKVQCFSELSVPKSWTNLNTSYVKVQSPSQLLNIYFEEDLNTSYVKVQLSQD